MRSLSLQKNKYNIYAKTGFGLPYPLGQADPHSLDPVSPACTGHLHLEQVSFETQFSAQILSM